MLKTAQLTGALILVLTLCLPMSRCTTYYDSHGQAALWGAQPSDAEKTQYIFPLFAIPVDKANVQENILSEIRDGLKQRPNVFSPYFVLLSFIWPLAVIRLSQKPKLKRCHQVAFWLEFIPLTHAGFITYGLGYCIGQPLIGFFTGAAGVALSALAWIIDVINTIRAGFNRNHCL